MVCCARTGLNTTLFWEGGCSLALRPEVTHPTSPDLTFFIKESSAIWPVRFMRKPLGEDECISVGVLLAVDKVP